MSKNTTLRDPAESFRPRTLVELLRRRALRAPDQIGYTFLADGEEEEVHLTYGELDAKARAVAAALRSSGGRGERVLLLYPPGLEFISAFFGCLYAGTVAVPAYPPRLNRNLLRVQSILSDAQATKVMATSAILRKVEATFGAMSEFAGMQWLCTDDLPEADGDEWQEPPVTSDSLAFLQYTSGSTGAPKGVMLTHGNLLHNAHLIYRTLGHTPDDRYVSWLPTFHDMGFMAGVLQPVYGGFPGVLMPPAAFLQRPLRWLRAISRYGGTTSGGPNFAYDLCVSKFRAEECESLDLSKWSTAFNGAEPVRADTLSRFSETFAPYGFRREAFYPCYGLAEATLMVSGGSKSDPPVVCEVSSEALERNLVARAGREDEAKTLVGCGRSMYGQEVIVVEPESLAVCGPDEIGEIWVRGESVARGYWNREAETEETFGARPAGEGGAPYLRTGDLGFLRDGELFVTGRLKDLIIIRGLNHYPQDIELTAERSHAALRPGCGAAFSVEVEGEERLVVVQEVEVRGDPPLPEVAAAVRQAVSEAYELQVYAVSLVRPGTIPKTSSGKIQRRRCKADFLENALDEVHRSVADEHYAPEAEGAAGESLASYDGAAPGLPRLESYFREQVARALRVDPRQVDAHSPLTALGVDSLAAAELRNRFAVDLGLDVSAAALLQDCSVARLAALALEGRRGEDAGAPRADADAAGETTWHPLSYTQQALWVLYQLAPESAAYNVSFAAQISSALDEAALRSAFQELSRRHAALRVTFRVREGRPVQEVHEDAEVCFTHVDASALGADELEERLAREAHRPFDLERGPLMRVYLFSRSASEHVLLLSVHHIAIDGWSLWVLLDELRDLYAAAKGGGVGAGLPPLSKQYADYVRWQEETLAGSRGEQLWSYWRKELEGARTVLDLPTSRPRPPVQTYNGASHAFEVDEGLARRLRALARRKGVTLYVVLLAAFEALLYRYTGQEDILVGAPTSGRSRSEFEGIVGCFFNALVLRARLDGGLRFDEFLLSARDTMLRALEHQDYPSHLLAERLNAARDPSRPPLFQVTFILQKPHRFADSPSLFGGGAAAPTDGRGLELKFLPLGRRAARADLEVEMVEAAGPLRGWFHYNTDLFDEDAAARMARHYETLLSGIADDPARRIADLPLLSEGERRQLLVEWSNAGRGFAAAAPPYVDELFDRQAAKTPDKVVAVHHHLTLTYGELGERAGKLADLIMELRR